MLAAQRRQRILEQLQANGGVLIAGLSDLLDVSDMTIRRDLAGLERDGLLQRVHGGAMSASQRVDEPGFDKKVLREQPEKAAIAAVAATFVKPGAAIGLSAGTTTWMLARRLGAIGDVTVVTNSMRVWAELHPPGGAPSRVILTGGEMLTPSDALVGPTADATIRSLFVDILFIGVHGMDPGAGYTTPDLSEAETNRAFIAHARRVVVLADHTKWRTVALGIMGPLDAAQTVITDSRISEEGQQLLAGQVHDVRVARPRAATSELAGR